MMGDRFEFDLVSSRTTSSSTKSRRFYSQRNVSSLQHELTKSRKMINMKATTKSTATTLSRTISFKPSPVTNSSIANVENTPVKRIPIRGLSFDEDTSNAMIVQHEGTVNNECIEETPVKEGQETNELSSSEIMAREIQRLSLRLRSAAPLYNGVNMENQPNKPTTLHLSQVVNRASRCNYVLRRFVREAEKYSPKVEDTRPSSLPVKSMSSTMSTSHEKGRRRLFADSPKQKASNVVTDDHQMPVTPRKASGVIKQLFSSPSTSLKRSLTSPNDNSTNNDKRQRLF